jgi:anti-sigma-K factor RskA
MTDQGPDISGSKGPGEDEVDLAAAEYVLGLTEGDARSIARERASADPAFAARIDAWEQRFSPLTGDVGEVTPPDTVWERIAGSIIAPSNVVALPNRPRWMNSLTVWRATAALSTLAAACLAIVLILPTKPSAPHAQQIATLTAPDGRPLYVATLDPAQNAVTVIPVGQVAASGRSPELWIIPAGGRPRPIGLLRVVSAKLPATAAVLSDSRVRAILAVSLEPRGGSTTGAPTGPVIAAGTLRPL